MKYRVILTLDAKDSREAAEILCDSSRWPTETRMRIQDVNLRRTVRMAAVLAAAIAIWWVAASCLIDAWKSIPR